MSAATADTEPIETTGGIADPADIVNVYLGAFYSGDFDRARTVVADGFSFRGPLLQVEGGDAFFAGAEGLRPIVGGHRLLRQWVDGDEVASLYEVDLVTPSGEGSVVMSEWHTVRDGRLTSARVIFDTAVFRSLVTPQAEGEASAQGLSPPTRSATEGG